MKKIMFVFLVIASLNASAQTVRFCDSNNYWQTSGNPYTSSISSAWTFVGTIDSLGNTYRVLKANYLLNEGTGLLPYTLTYDVREDTANNIVYILNGGGEDTLYNYNRQVGDTFYVDGNRAIVVSIESTVFRSGYYKMFSMRLNDDTDTAYHYMQGMGSIDNPVFPFYRGPVSPYSELVTCFLDNIFTPAINFPGIFTLKCPPSTEAATVSNSEHINLYPNPATSALTIEADEAIHQVIVTNLLGQTISSSAPERETVNIDVSGWPGGIYFVKINSNDVRRFVKE